jgi:AraC family transcriptional regulator
MQKMWQQIYSEYMPSVSYRPSDIPELEVYPDGDTTAEDYTCEIWIPVQKTDS